MNIFQSWTIGRLIIVYLLSLAGSSICLADTTALPETIPDGWQFKCSIVVFTADTMKSTTIESSGRCTVMGGRSGTTNYVNQVYMLNKDELNEIYSLARETISTYQPKPLEISKIPAAKRNKAMFNYITLSLQVGPDQKNGIGASVYASPADFEICHFSRLLNKIKAITRRHQNKGIGN